MAWASTAPWTTRPAGGGPGMVMRADVAAAAIDAVARNERPLIYLSPRGVPLTQARVRELAAGPGAILLCGRFEGLDQRVIEARAHRRNLAWAISCWRGARSPPWP